MSITIGKNIFYTPEDVGRIMGVNAITVRNLMRTGQLPAHKFGGRWLISEEKLTAALSGEWKPDPPADAK